MIRFQINGVCLRIIRHTPFYGRYHISKVRIVNVFYDIGYFTVEFFA